MFWSARADFFCHHCVNQIQLYCDEHTPIQSNKNAAAATAARAERDGLRNQINTATAALPTATCTSARDYAATAAAVFEQCAAALEELATKADGHATDSRTLTNSWPTTERKP